MLSNLTERIKDYCSVSMEIYKLKFVAWLAGLLSSILSFLLVTLIFILFFLLVNIGISLWLGEFLGKNYLGFFVVAGFYLFLGIIFNMFKNQLVRKPIEKKIINSVLK